MANLNPEDFTRLATFFVPENITALAFSPDGRLLAVAAADKVHIYRVPPQATGSDTSAGSSK
ncbi:MAG: hypothetical protein RMJ43_05715 [Chloroherpetonaceae bacterium]|nr:hypothetical protein [Chthonomonadaceae bacterium]MDW8207313.1 hypothetical protein [Chloroherpetonaceae bacterium]